MISEAFFSGAICMGLWVITLFFLRFWKRTRDRLFLFFACSFVLLLIEKALRIGATAADPAVYLIRLVAFVLLIVAIIDKNRRS
jgi:hypothetical protein